MINQYDLYDIAFALIMIRSNICEELNTAILSQIVNVLEDRNSTEDNQIRKAISVIEGLDRDRWFFVYHDNVYVNHRLLKSSDIYGLLIKLIKDLICVLNKGEFDKAYDLVDVFHCLPEIIADNHFTIPKSYWKSFVKCYRNKWDNDFLRVEQKKFKKYL